MGTIDQRQLAEWQAVNWNTLDEVLSSISDYSTHNDNERATLNAFQQYVNEQLQKADPKRCAAALVQEVKKNRAFYLILQAAIVEREALSTDDSLPQCKALYLQAAGIYHQAAQLHVGIARFAYWQMACIYHYEIKDLANTIACYQNAANFGDIRAIRELGALYASPVANMEVLDRNDPRDKIHNPFLDYVKAAYYVHCLCVQVEIWKKTADAINAIMAHIDQVPLAKKLETRYRVAMSSRNPKWLDQLFKDPEQVFKTLHFMLCEDTVASHADQYAIFVRYETFLTEELCNAPQESYFDIKQKLNNLLFMQLLQEVPFQKNQKSQEAQWRARLQHLIQWNGKQASDWKWLISWHESLSGGNLWRSIAALQWMLTDPELHFPEAARHFLYYVAGTAYMHTGNSAQAKKIYELIPYDAELPAEQLFDIGSLFLTDIPLVSSKPKQMLPTIKEDEKMVVEDEKNPCLDIKPAPIFSIKQQTKIINKALNAECAAAKRALPYLLTAAHRDCANQAFKKNALSTWGIATGMGNIPMSDESLSVNKASQISRQYWIEMHINPLHERVRLLLARAKARTTDVQQQEKLNLTSARVQMIYNNCVKSKIKTTAYRDETKTIIQELLTSKEITEHKNKFTKIGRALLNVLFVFSPSFRKTWEYEIDDTHVSWGAMSYFFSFSTKRQVEAKKLLQDLEKAPCFTL